MIGLMLTLGRVVPSLAKAFLASLVKCNNLRYAGLSILCNISENLGKCGYFVGIKVEEYDGTRK